jgi:hypothetical protein
MKAFDQWVEIGPIPRSIWALTLLGAEDIGASNAFFCLLFSTRVRAESNSAFSLGSRALVSTFHSGIDLPLAGQST